MLYSSKNDDAYINTRGGVPLYISGTCIRNSHYAVIDSASCLFFNQDSSSLQLLTHPYIMNTKTFEPITLDNLIRKGVVTDKDYIFKLQDALNHTKWYSKEKEYRTISAYGGLGEYILLLHGFQTHIKEVAMKKNME
jgi:hypothetical protein